jgi:hypothetical protein
MADHDDGLFAELVQLKMAGVKLGHDRLGNQYFGYLV